MSTLDLIRTLRRTLNHVRDAHDDSAVAELARALIAELNGELLERSTRVRATHHPHVEVDVTDNAPPDADDIHVGGMAVYA